MADQRITNNNEDTVDADPEWERSLIEHPLPPPRRQRNKFMQNSASTFHSEINLPVQSLFSSGGSGGPVENSTIEPMEHSSIDSGYVSGMMVRSSLYDPQSEHMYKMNHRRRGKMVIINQQYFSENVQQQKLGERKGTDVDAKNLRRVFEGLGFEVILLNDLTTSAMLQAIVQVAEEDHWDADCFALAILSHGDDGLVYGTDGPIRIGSLIAPIKSSNCPTLVGKPKLFFIQACRGTEFDEGITFTLNDTDESDAQTDDDEVDSKTYTIPLEADFMYAYSTPPGHFAFRHEQNGAWFIQAITKVFSDHGTQLEMNQLMVRVNKMIAYEFKSSSRVAANSNKKQVSSIVSMLTKELYFPPKTSK